MTCKRGEKTHDDIDLKLYYYFPRPIYLKIYCFLKKT